jgi:hypothetical protein
MALRLGGFTEEQLSLRAPPTHENYGTYAEYRPIWALTRLKEDGVVLNPNRGRWAFG